MRVRSQIRTWYRLALCGVLALAVPVSADTTPQAATSSKKKSAHHLASTPKSAKGHAVSHRSASKASAHKSKAARKTKSKSKKRGQQVIDSERTRQIQEALSREHYLEGEPSGAWDAATQAAMQRYQADQGWQTKTIPDSRALIKLGLGPSPEHLLNPESAMTSSVAPASAKSDAKPSAADPPASPSSKTPSEGTPQQ